jgi:serine phosphatase RsbU (regulator of sigma subunit)
VKLDEAGGLWIAIGDVAGHGYSCAIVQAMTIAALASFIAQGRGPAEILHSVDRVIRRSQTPRNFTSVSLLRIEPATGEAVLGNAGHPYPLLATVQEKNSEVVEIPLPGLPLGQGPDRVYREHRFSIPPGATLVLYTDGLIESRDARDVPYGFDRPREVLRHPSGTAGAEAVLAALLADWRRHLGGEEPSDDTTVLVLTRSQGSAIIPMSPS